MNAALSSAVTSGGPDVIVVSGASGSGVAVAVGVAVGVADAVAVAVGAAVGNTVGAGVAGEGGDGCGVAGGAGGAVTVTATARQLLVSLLSRTFLRASAHTSTDQRRAGAETRAVSFALARLAGLDRLLRARAEARVAPVELGVGREHDLGRRLPGARATGVLDRPADRQLRALGERGGAHRDLADAQVGALGRRLRRRCEHRQRDDRQHEPRHPCPYPPVDVPRPLGPASANLTVAAARGEGISRALPERLNHWAGAAGP